MNQNAPLSTIVRGLLVVVTVLLHPLLLYLFLPVFGEPANFVGVVAPITATLLFSWRVGLAATLVNVIVSARMFMLLTTMGAGEGRPKAVFSLVVLAAACFGAEKLRRYIDQRRAIVEELNQARKMEAVGRLAGGVAHDINNTLNSILASVVAHRRELEPDGRQFQDLDNIAAACERGAQLTRNLLGFARRTSYQRQTICLNDVVECVHALLKRTANKNIRIDSRVDARRPAMVGDKAQLESAVMNLCINALDAMGESGTLTMTTGQEAARSFLCVRDTGIGMDNNVKERVFEPFFTTKAEGKGTGLGLSLVYGAVHAMSGHIVLATAPGKGTSITLLFPTTTAAPVASVPAPDLRPAPNPMYLSGRTVLLIDDEPLVLRSSARMLMALGCHVLTAGSGREGTAIVKERGGAVDLVIADLIMPDMDGIAAIEAIHLIKPSIPVILASGYTRETDRLEAIKQRRDTVRFLAKPYRTAELMEAAKELLGLEETSESTPPHRGVMTKRPVSTRAQWVSVLHIPLRQKIRSYFRPLSLKRSDSAISGYLDLLLYRNRFHLLAADASYSDGARYFPAVAVARYLKKFLPAAKNLLVLGAGLGSIVEVLRARGYSPHYTLVEKDKTVLAWAREILGEDDSLEFVLEDAGSFMAKNERKYDLVFVDIFRGRAVPDFVTSLLFLRQCRDCLTPGGRLALNYIEVHKKKWEKVQRVFTGVFPGGHIVSKEENRIMISLPSSSAAVGIAVRKA